MASTALARRPYDLRHAILSLWLDAAGTSAEVAARTGTSTRVPHEVDPVSQDDLVFPGGTLHVVSALGESLSFHINPHSCLFTGTSRLTWQVTSGTGKFADATGSLQNSHTHAAC